MMDKRKIAVIHERYLPMPAEAVPTCANFTESAALSFVKANIEKTMGRIDEAGKAKPDLICTHEDFAGLSEYCRTFDPPGLFASLAGQVAEMVEGGMREAAKRHCAMIAENHFRIMQGKVYNVSTLYGKDGEIIGQYQKVHLADSERWQATPGENFPVFATDIGNIGFAICYDIIFPEACRILALNGADIVIHPTQGWGTGGKGNPFVGEGMLRSRAAENSVFLIVAKNLQADGFDGGRSCVIDPYGNMIAESPIADEQILMAEMEPDFDLYDEHNFNSLFSGVPSVRARQAMARRPELYAALATAHPAVIRRYADMPPFVTGETAPALMEAWERMPDSERKRFHW